MTKPKPCPPNHRAIIVCTDKRGVFFGYVPNDGPSNEDMLSPDARPKLFGARMAVYWTNAERGVMGLASAGPGPQCRIGAAADIVVKDIHAVIDVTNESAARWELAPWG